MQDNVSLKSFPSDKYEAVTMLYLQNQDLSDKTPEELFMFYMETYKQIRKYAKAHSNDDWMHIGR